MESTWDETLGRWRDARGRFVRSAMVPSGEIRVYTKNYETVTPLPADTVSWGSTWGARPVHPGHLLIDQIAPMP